MHSWKAVKFAPGKAFSQPPMPAGSRHGVSAMESGFGVLDAFVFIVFGILIAAALIIVVSLGKLPGQLAVKWKHPQASAINALSWIGIATGGLLWPIAFVWAFTTPGTKSASTVDESQSSSTTESLPSFAQDLRRKVSQS
jgi:hypothetical protein